MTQQPTANWGTWQQTRNTLVQTLSMNIEGRNAATPGSTDALAYTGNIDQNVKDLQEHALSGLRQIDLEIASSGTIAGLKAASQDAKREADRLKKAKGIVDDLIKLTGKLTTLVKGIHGLS